MNPSDDNTTTHLTRYFDAITGAYFDSNNTEVNEILVAYSGGVDSTVLLLLAAEFASNNQLPLSAVHINHNLSANAGQWQQHCTQICQQMNIPLTVKSVTVDARGVGVEAAAREARYAAIAEVATERCLVMLGQHQQDQIETFLIQLLRGAGPEGLSGMAEYSVNQYGTRLLRPLLSMSRADIEHFAQAKAVNWIEDESNASCQFERNFLRNKVLPLIGERWPEMGKTMSRSMSHLKEQNDLLRESVVDKLKQLSTANGYLDINALRSLSQPWQKQVLKHWIGGKGVMQPSQNVLLRIIDDCLNGRDDAQPEVKWGRWQCCRYNNELYLLPQATHIPQGAWVLKIDTKEDSVLELPADAGVIRLKRQAVAGNDKGSLNLPDNAELLVTFGGFSRRFRPVNETVSKPINQWFKTWRVPPWERQKTPILQYQNEVLAVGNQLAKQALGDNLSAYELVWQAGFKPT